jgi:hypothetical protein
MVSRHTRSCAGYDGVEAGRRFVDIDVRLIHRVVPFATTVPGSRTTSMISVIDHSLLLLSMIKSSTEVFSCEVTQLLSLDGSCIGMSGHTGLAFCCPVRRIYSHVNFSWDFRPQFSVILPLSLRSRRTLQTHFLNEKEGWRCPVRCTHVVHLKFCKALILE